MMGHAAPLAHPWEYVQGLRRSSLGANPSHPVLAVIASTPKRTPKVMYACIRGIPTLKESWLTACVAAHKLLPLDAFQQDVSQRSQGHRAFQGLALHLAGDPLFQHSWSRLIHHAGAPPTPSQSLHICLDPSLPYPFPPTACSSLHISPLNRFMLIIACICQIDSNGWMM